VVVFFTHGGFSTVSCLFDLRSYSPPVLIAVSRSFFPSVYPRAVFTSPLTNPDRRFPARPGFLPRLTLIDALFLPIVNRLSRRFSCLPDRDVFPSLLPVTVVSCFPLQSRCQLLFPLVQPTTPCCPLGFPLWSPFPWCFPHFQTVTACVVRRSPFQLSVPPFRFSLFPLVVP